MNISLSKKFKEFANDENKTMIIGLLTILVFIWLVIYLIPSFFVSLFDTFLGRIILVVIVILVSINNYRYGLMLALILIIFTRFVDIVRSTNGKENFEILSKLNIQQKIFDPHDGYQHWVYVGRGGEDMALSLKVLFLAIQKHRQHNPEIWQKIKIHFVGTKYSIFDNNKEIEAIAKSYNLDDIITEYPQRIPYFEALQVLKDSHAILIIGSDDPSYSASKVYPCILAQKPILAILHEQSLVVNVIKECQAGYTVTFTNLANIEIYDTLGEGIEWLLNSLVYGLSETTDWQAFEPYTARQMTRTLCQIFDQSANPKSR